MTLPVVFTANGATGYNLTKSLRFRSSASAYLNRTPASAGNRRTFTFSAWVKRGALGSDKTIFGAYSTSSDSGQLYVTFQSDNKIAVGWFTGEHATTSVFRDPSAWYHIVVVVDTTQATALNRTKVYVNGIEQTMTVNVGSSIPQNTDTAWNNSVAQSIGSHQPYTGWYSDGYMAEVNSIDGQALTPSSFGSTNALTGVWQPAKYTGTYGTNGFYLPFTNTTSTSTLGNDFSGNSNTWTVNNISLTVGSTYDSMNDVPTLTSATTANYCVLNPISSGGTITNGNLSTSNNDTTTYGTVAITTGKFYWEYTITACSGGAAIALGVSKDTSRSPAGVWGASDVFLYQSGGNKYGNGTSGAYGATYTTGDVIGVALDMTGYTLTFYKNNVSQGTAFSSTQISPYTLIPMFYGYPSGNSTNVNFGQQPFTYTPPTGFVALNTFNLPTSTIVKGNTVMDATTYTGTGSSLAVVNTAGFKPDFVWTKPRSTAVGHTLFDSIRGVTNYLQSNTTGAEGTAATSLTAFNTNGFTVNSDTSTGANGVTYVGWQWQAGQGSSSSNTSGSITSTVSVNATAGFSVVTYTGNGTGGATVGHGLGVAPAMMIIKTRSAVNSWVVYHQSLGNTKAIYLNLTNAADTNSSFWNNTSPTSSVLTLGTDTICNQNGTTYVAYCWTPIAGYSAFGSYTGNGSTDGPFVYTGFRPKFVLVKRTDSGGDWGILDTARNTYNLASLNLFPNDSRAEGNLGFSSDLLSNGFKLRTNDTFFNASGGTYIYMAFAENPFKNALAR